MSDDMIEHMAQDMAMPIMRDMSTVKINLCNGQSVDVFREDIRKSLEDELYKSIRKIGRMY